MNEFQKSALGVMFSVCIFLAWLASVFMEQFIKDFKMNDALQGAALATIVLVIGISTPIGPAIGRGGKKILGAIKKGMN
jgi:uncharacterized membrane protein (GlpM family)